MASTNPSLPENAVWFVTGTSSGIGFSLISSILSTPGHRIVILSRNPTSIPLPSSSNDTNTLLQPIDLKSPASITAAFNAALEKFGRIDVVINNAGYGLRGELESIKDDESRELFEVNYWAPVQITRHAMGIMRDVNPKSGPIGGVIAQISSIGGYIGFGGQSQYHASKFALEGFTEAVSKETDPAWAIRFVIFEPGSVRTKWSSDNMGGSSYRHPAYVGKGLATERMESMKEFIEDKIGAEANAVAGLIVGVVTGEKGSWNGKEVLRLPVGADAFALAKTEADEQVKKIAAWKEISESTSTGGVKDALRSLGMWKD